MPISNARKLLLGIPCQKVNQNKTNQFCYFIYKNIGFKLKWIIHKIRQINLTFKSLIANS
jgi:hypothetical protein